MRFKIKGDKEMTGAILFVISIISFLGAFYFYSQADSTAYQATKDLMDECNKKYNKLDDLVASNIATVGSFNQRILDLKAITDDTNKDLEAMDHHIAAVEEKCKKLEQKQIETQDRISNKRPVIKFTEPVPVQIIEKKGKGVDSLLKKSGVKK